MSSNLRMYTKALYEFDHVIRLVPPTAWANPTPCADWNVRDVVGHVIAVQCYIESLALGNDVPMNPYEEPGRFAGDDAATTWRESRDAALAALDQPGMITRSVQTFRATETLDSLIGWNVVDTLAHAWDVAQGARVPLDLSEDLVAHATEQATPIVDKLRVPPFFGEATSGGTRDDQTAQFLRMLGRDPEA